MKFRSICRHRYLSPIYGILLEEGKEYTIYPSLKGNIICHYDIYDGEIPIIAYMKTPVNGMSTRSFPTYFYTHKEVRELKLEKILSNV